MLTPLQHLIKAILLRRFNQTVDHGAGLRATRRVGKEPVLPAHHKGLNAALGTVVSSGGVTHSGDNRTGEGEGDDEAVTIEFEKVPSYVEKIVVTVTIYEAQARGQNFGQVANAFVRLVDKQTGVELLRYDLGEDYSTETAIVFAEIYRHNGEWKFSAVGSGFNGGLEALCRQYGLSV